MARIRRVAAGERQAGALAWPGVVLRKGCPHAAAVRRLQRRLRALGYPGGVTPGVFDAGLEAAVRLFQAQHADCGGAPLRVDGRVGQVTWEALFPPSGAATVAAPPGPLAVRALAVAAAQIGVMERPPGSNRGPEVDAYLERAGIAPGAGPAAARAWCAAFVYWCFDAAAGALGVSNPLPRTAGVLDHWRKAGRAGVTRLAKAQVLAQPGLLGPGAIFVHDYGQGLGHTGIVERIEGPRLVTIEGNINDGSVPGREGIGVFRTRRRRIGDDRLVGFLVY